MAQPLERLGGRPGKRQRGLAEREPVQVSGHDPLQVLDCIGLPGLDGDDERLRVGPHGGDAVREAHESSVFRQLDVDAFGLEKLENFRLVFEIRAKPTSSPSIW